MECLNPVLLNSGLVVGCGKCELCLSRRRDEWSVRLGVEVKFNDKMPLFVTLTYNDKNVPSRWHSDQEGVERGIANSGGGRLTLWRKDVSSFLKALKRKYNLDDETFHYFGCGEYGDSFGRPHYHLLFFGFDFLDEVFENDTEKANKLIADIWQKGFVHICRAGFDGIHYVTKYCLKENFNELADFQVKPFTICSKNLGASWFKSNQCMHYKRKLARLSNLDIFDIVGYVDMNKDYLRWCLEVLKNYVPDLKVELDDGRILPLPRYFRKRLIGSFQRFSDGPMWVYNWIKLLYETLCFYDEFENCTPQEIEQQQYDHLLSHIERINRRLLSKHNKIIKVSNYESI